MYNIKFMAFGFSPAFRPVRKIAKIDY